MEEVSAFAIYNAGNKNKKKTPQKRKRFGKTTATINKDQLKKELINEMVKESAAKLQVDLDTLELSTQPVKSPLKNKKNKKGNKKLLSPKDGLTKPTQENAETAQNSKEKPLKRKTVKRLQCTTPKKAKVENTGQQNKTKKGEFSKESFSVQNGISANSTAIISDSTSNSNSPSPETFPVTQCKSEPISPKRSTILANDSIQDGLNIFKYLLKPVEVNRFFDEFWEKEPCLVQRNDPSYFSNFISFGAIDEMLLKNHVEFTKHIDITSYTNGVRETLNPEGRALPGTVWEHYDNGCSVRLLNPQIFIPAIYTLNATLQEYFHCMVGANVYLTPPSSQGFAPHYDDIEAFVLQIEGQKRWKLYNPRSRKEALPRVSSKNFNQDEIGEPILDKVLKPGDILYFPRGTIHQAKTEGINHSLHITLSIYQKQSYADLFEILFPMMLSRAIEDNIDLRRGLPLNIWHNLGVVHSDTRSKDREEILKKCRNLLQQVVNQIPVDEAVDQMAKKYQHDALPPEITPGEKSCTFYGVRNYLNEDGKPECNLEITDETNIRLLRANILRLVEEGEKVHIYFYTDNSREYHEYDPNFLEIGAEDAPTVEFLIKCYPEYVAVKNLPIDDELQRFSVVQGLFDRGLLMLDKPIV